GIDFSTKNFTRSIKMNEKGEWIATFTVRDQPSVQEIILTVFNNGNVLANANSLRRERIQFRGYIEPLSGN
ncbi:MAG: DUF4251 domain-containing protein, partial [Chitinophagaceae bacterium]